MVTFFRMQVSKRAIDGKPAVWPAFTWFIESGGSPKISVYLILKACSLMTSRESQNAPSYTQFQGDYDVFRS